MYENSRIRVKENTRRPGSVFILAPIVKKPGSGPPGKHGTGKSGALMGKVPGGKITATVNPTKVQSKPSPLPTPSKAAVASPSTSSKNVTTYSYATPKSNKSTTLGIIWLPTRKHNKKKEIAYNSHRNERHKEYKDRGPSMYNFMSGDSNHTNKKEDNSEKDLLVPNSIPVAIAGASATAVVVEPGVITAQPEEKQEFINPEKNKEEPNETARSNEKTDSDYLDHNDSTDKSLDSKWDQGKGDKGDKVDSVYLRPPPPHKSRSNTSTPATEDEDCGIKCLYYTLQCCDCVLM